MRSTRRVLLLTVATTLLSGVLTGLTPAQAASPNKIGSLAKTLGADRSAGFFRDSGGTFTLNVTDAGAMAQAQAAGIKTQLVTRSMRALANVMENLDSGVPGTAWSIDVVSNQVLVAADSTVSAGALGQLEAAVANANGAARFARVDGTFRPTISGGDAIYGGGYRCSLGFNVRSGSTYYFLTAGHCGKVASEWFSNSNLTTKLGNTNNASFPGNDYALVQYTNTSITIDGGVGGQDIASAADAYVGESVKRRGSTTGTKSGSVTGLNATVHYSSGGTVKGMIQTNVCAEPGDSGGPLYDGSIAVGLTSGGSGNCSSGGTTFFQPVTEALAKYHVSVF